MGYIDFTGPNGAFAATDVFFRQFSSVSSAFVTAGLVRTADTGQVNWATVTMPADATWTAYDIFRFNDSTQATDPIFIRVDYGTLNPNSNGRRLFMRFTFGSGSNGSGTITGVINSSPLYYWVTLDATDVSTTENFSMGGDGAGIAMIGGHSNGTTSPPVGNFLLFERARKADGTPWPGQLFFACNQLNALVGTSWYNSNGGDTSFVHLTSVGPTVTLTAKGFPVAYAAVAPLSTSSFSILASGKYPFGVLGLPLAGGMGYSKLMIGYAWGDFARNTEFDVDRFSGPTTIHYKAAKPDSTARVYRFGLMDFNASNNTATNPFVFATPAIYWQ